MTEYKINTYKENSIPFLYTKDKNQWKKKKTHENNPFRNTHTHLGINLPRKWKASTEKILRHQHQKMEGLTNSWIKQNSGVKMTLLPYHTKAVYRFNLILSTFQPHSSQTQKKKNPKSLPGGTKGQREAGPVCSTESSKPVKAGEKGAGREQTILN